jgi:hypothetical protein
MMKPYKSGRTWTGWPTAKAGDKVPVQFTCTGFGEDRVDVYDGDILIESFKKSAYGLYSTTWTAVAGFRGIVAVAYKENVPVAVSRLVVVIVDGNVSYPPVDNGSMGDPTVPVAVNLAIRERGSLSPAQGAALRIPSIPRCLVNGRALVQESAKGTGKCSVLRRRMATGAYILQLEHPRPNRQFTYGTVHLR